VPRRNTDTRGEVTSIKICIPGLKSIRRTIKPFNPNKIIKKYNPNIFGMRIELLLTKKFKGKNFYGRENS